MNSEATASETSPAPRHGSQRSQFPLEGIALALGIVTTAWWMGMESREELIRGNRWLARASVPWFLLAFTASAFRTRWPSGWTRSLLRYRRRLGLDFAMLNLVHLGTLFLFAWKDPEFFRSEIGLESLLVGGFGFVLVLMMTATSNDAAIRALGSGRWKTLHRRSSWYLWFVIFVTYLSRIPDRPGFWPGLVVVVLAGVLRWRPHSKRLSRVPAG